MKNLRLTSLICGGVLSLTAGALAQQSSTPGSQSSSSSQDTSTSLRQSSSLGSQSGALSSSTAFQSGNTTRLSQVMNSSVQSQEGKTLGHIRDLTIDPQSGRVEFAILSLSSAGAAADTSTSGRETVPSSRSSTIGTPSGASAASVSGKLVPVPWQMFNQSWSTPGTTTASAGPNLVLNIDESKLRSAPSFEASNWNELQEGTFDQRVYSYFGVDQTSATGTPGSSITGRGTSSQDRDSSTSSPSNPSSSNPSSSIDR